MEIVGVLIVGLVVGLAVGAVLGWLARQHLVASPAPEESPEVLAARHEAELERARLHQEAVVASVRHEEATARAAVQAELAAARAAVEELRDALEAAREQHREFVAEHRAQQQERERAEAGASQVLKTLSPVAQQLQAMRQRVDELEKQRSHQHGELAEQLRTTQHSVAESKKAADTLAAALTNNAVRGVWGETQLRTLVESAGLLQRVDFDLQHSIEADTGARRPDMVINLPGGKQMAIDAKVPYNAFIDAHRTGIQPEERQRLLGEHAKKVRGHVDALAQKSYWTGLSASPEFTVAFTWRQEVLTEDAKRLFDLGRELYRRIVTMAEHAEKLRRSLESTIKSYNAFAGSLESRVLVTARKLDQMDESTVLPRPATIELSPKPLTSGDFEAIADLDRPELTFELDAVEAVEAELVDDDRAAERAAG